MISGLERDNSYHFSNGYVIGKKICIQNDKTWFWYNVRGYFFLFKLDYIYKRNTIKNYLTLTDHGVIETTCLFLLCKC